MFLENGDWRAGRDDIEDSVVREVLGRMILHWNYRNLTSLPEQLLQNGEHVREIYLKRNCLQELPKDVGKLRNLTNIYLSGNKLRRLGPEIDQLSQLEVLDLSQNALSDLPSSLGKLVRLQQLILTHNQLKTLPVELQNLKNLEFLELSDNLLPVVPEQIIHGLENLREFCIDRNPHLKFLPKNLVFRRKLRSVSACKCDLRLLPGVPFHGLVHGFSSSRRRSRSPRNNSSNGNNNLNDELQFQIRFDGNAHLNTIPYWLLRAYGPHLESFGCGGSVAGRPSGDPDPSLPFVRSNIVDDGNNKAVTHYYFYYDPSLAKLRTEEGGGGGGGGGESVSLLEMSLRNLYANRDVKSNEALERDWTEELPSDLSKLLIMGPTARCFQCSQSIFTEMWPLVFRLQTQVVELDVAELAYPNNSIINAYNHKQRSLQERAGVVGGGGGKSGFYFCNVGFCSFGCKQLFIKTISSGSYLPFHDMNLIVRNQIPLY